MGGSKERTLGELKRETPQIVSKKVEVFTVKPPRDQGAKKRLKREARE